MAIQPITNSNLQHIKVVDKQEDRNITTRKTSDIVKNIFKSIGLFLLSTTIVGVPFTVIILKNEYNNSSKRIPKLRDQIKKLKTDLLSVIEGRHFYECVKHIYSTESKHTNFYINLQLPKLEKDLNTLKVETQKISSIKNKFNYTVLAFMKSKNDLKNDLKVIFMNKETELLNEFNSKIGQLEPLEKRLDSLEKR